MANPKRIGNNYEREISKKLSLWISNGESDDIFWRDLSSGARFTNRKKKEKETVIKGDIVAIDLNYQWFTNLFFIDTKCYKSFNPFFIDPKNKKSNEILNQWKKVISDCPTSMIPMMICKIRDRKTSEFIMIDFKKDVTMMNIFLDNIKHYMQYYYDNGEKLSQCYIFTLDDFFDKIRVEIL